MAVVPSLASIAMESCSESFAGIDENVPKRTVPQIGQESWQALFEHLRLVPGALSVGSAVPEIMVQRAFEKASLLCLWQRRMNSVKGNHTLATPNAMVVHQPLRNYRFFYRYQFLNTLHLTALRGSDVREVTRYHFPSLQTLSIVESPELNDSDLGPVIHALGELKTLELEQCSELSPKLLQWIAWGECNLDGDSKITSFRLGKLAIHHCKNFKFETISDISGLYALKSSLTGVDFDFFNGIDDTFTEVANAVMRFVSVLELDSLRLMSSPQQLSLLEPSESFHNITQLELYGFREFTWQELVPIVIYCPQLSVLSVSQATVNHEFVDLLHNVSNLKVLRLPYANISDADGLRNTSLMVFDASFATFKTPATGLGFIQQSEPSVVEFSQSTMSTLYRAEEEVEPFDSIRHLTLGEDQALEPTLVAELLTIMPNLRSLTMHLFDGIDPLPSNQRTNSVVAVNVSRTHSVEVDHWLSSDAQVDILAQTVPSSDDWCDEAKVPTPVCSFAYLFEGVRSLDLSNVCGAISASTVLGLPFHLPYLAHLRLGRVLNSLGYKFQHSQDRVLLWIATHRSRFLATTEGTLSVSASQLRELMFSSDSIALTLQDLDGSQDTGNETVRLNSVGFIVANILGMVKGLGQFTSFDDILSTHTVESLKEVASQLFVELLEEHRSCAEHGGGRQVHRSNTGEDLEQPGQSIARTLVPAPTCNTSVLDAPFLNADIPAVAVPKCTCSVCVEKFPELYRDQTKLTYTAEELYSIGRTVHMKVKSETASPTRSLRDLLMRR